MKFVTISLPFATTWMGLEGTMLSEISQMEKDKYCMISLIHGNMTSKQSKNKHADTENRSVVTSRERGPWEESLNGKGGYLYGDEWRLDFDGECIYIYPSLVCTEVRFCYTYET